MSDVSLDRSGQLDDPDYISGLSKLGWGCLRCGMPAADAEAEARVDGLLATFERTSRGSRPPGLQASGALEELLAWLDDHNQWLRGAPRHWRTLLDDVVDRARLLCSLAEGSAQDTLQTLVAELIRLRGQFGGADSHADQSHRRELRRAATALESAIHQSQLLRSAWGRVARWSVVDPDRADEGIAALRDLVAVRGHDAHRLLTLVEHILADSEWAVATARGVPQREQQLAGATAAQRLDLARDKLMTAEPATASVVWLEYLQATVRWPPMLRLGEHVTLFNADYLRQAIYEQRLGDEIPKELEDPLATGLPIWMGAFDQEEAATAQHGDPRVFIRIQLGELPAPRLLEAARETAEFLPAYAALRYSNQDVWLHSDSYFVVGVESSSHAFSFDETRSRSAIDADSTAAELAEDATLLGAQLPVRDPRLRTAARLAVWLRRADGTDDPARLILCERVVEQVSGWAGVATPARFVEQAIKPGWMYYRLLSAIDDAYRRLSADARGRHQLSHVIDVPVRPPEHGPDRYLLSTVDRKAFLEHLDELVGIAPPGSTSAVRLQRLKARCADATAMKAWLADLENEFDRRNARLRRTRNALMHGGPLSLATVDDVARFAVTAAHQALSPAITYLLRNEDVVDGFLDSQERVRVCFQKLRRGTAPSEALFWKS
jgi:hypothetical protein